ncbi:MAG: hypothetical protein JXQ87_01610 [Bacteroidia bacterium]
MLKNIFVYISIFLPVAAFGQFEQLGAEKNDTTKKLTDQGLVKQFAIRTVFALEDSFLFKPAKFSLIDTTLNNFDLIDDNIKEGRYFQRINNYGSAAFNLEFEPIRKPGFTLGLRAHEQYNIKSDQLRYYDSYTPYSQFKYVQGDGELQKLDLFHSQSISEQWNIAITYRSLKSTGFYEQEANRLTNVAFHSKYQNEKGNYRLLAYSIFNTSDLNENGGIDNLEFFGAPGFQTLIARTSQNNFLDANYLVKNVEYGIRQFLYLGQEDSFEIEDFGKSTRYVPRAYISHKLTYTRNSSKFNTSDVGFFRNNYSFIDGELLENIEHRELSNEIGFGLFLNKREILEGDSNNIAKPYAEQVFYGGVDFRLGRAGFWGLERLTFQPPEDLIKCWGYGNLHLFGNLSKSLTPVTHFKGHINYVALGAQFSDYNADLQVRQVLFKKLVLSPFLRTQAVSPMFTQNVYVSTHSRWNNDFRKEFNNSLGATLSYGENTSITVTANRSDNFIYFDTIAQPFQSEIGINYFQVKIKKNLHLRKWHFENEISWQQINDDSPYQVPEILARINWYFQTPMFKEVLNLRIGFRAWYYSAYRGLNYMPGLGVFHVQQEKTVGGYPWLDVYITANVKKFNGFLKFTHVNDGFWGYQYEMLPNYPMAPRALRMGVAWRFYN